MLTICLREYYSYYSVFRLTHSSRYKTYTVNHPLLVKILAQPTFIHSNILSNYTTDRCEHGEGHLCHCVSGQEMKEKEGQVALLSSRGPTSLEAS